MLVYFMGKAQLVKTESQVRVKSMEIPVNPIYMSF